MSQHRAAHHVAYRVDMGRLGLTKIVNVNTTARVEADSTVGREHLAGTRLPAHGDDQTSKGFNLFTLSITEGDLDSAVFHFCRGDTGSETNIEALLLEYFLCFPRNLHIHHRQEIFQRLKHHNLGTQPSPDTAQFKADHAGADHAQTPRDFSQLERTRGVEDKLTVHRCHRNINGQGAGGDDHMACLQRSHVALAIGNLYPGT